MTDASPVAALLVTDCYKLDHRRQYGVSGEVTNVYSNYTNRRSRMSGVTKVVHFGLQAYIQQNLMNAFESFFAAPTKDVCWQYFEQVERVLGLDAAKAIGTKHVAALHKKGFLPLRFCAVPEGTLVPIGVPSFTVENTDPAFAWLTNYVETGLSFGIWQPSTSATIAHQYRKLLLDAAARTGASVEDIDYQLHDFSCRGMSSLETAAASAAGHLLSFKGTDSLPALDWIDRYYGGDYDAKSIPATEHSVMSAGTAVIGEYETYSRLLDLYPTGAFAIVSDTYNLWRVITEYLPKLKDKIMARDGKLIIRPDSGVPEKILCGDPDADIAHPARQGVVRLLADIFGTRLNSKGYHELDPHIGTLYGDSITVSRSDDITKQLEQMGFVSTTSGLGVGSFTYQYNTRDTFGSAMKATSAVINGKQVDLYKDPVTDDGTKRSATGRLAVVYNDNNEMVLIQRATPEQEAESLLQPVWQDGEWLQHQSFSDVRKVLDAQQSARRVK